MRLARTLLLLVVLAACPAAIAHADPRPPAPLPISGLWLWGTGAEPRRGPVRAVTHCGAAPATMQLREHDGAVAADVYEASRMTGGAVPPPARFRTSVTERLRGTFDGARLVLAGSHDVVHTPSTARPAVGFDDGPGPVRPPPDVHAPVRLELHFVARTGHFVGTRNGAPVWLARGVITPGTGACPP